MTGEYTRFLGPDVKAMVTETGKLFGSLDIVGDWPISLFEPFYLTTKTVANAGSLTSNSLTCAITVGEISL